MYTLIIHEKKVFPIKLNCTTHVCTTHKIKKKLNVLMNLAQLRFRISTLTEHEVCLTVLKK